MADAKFEDARLAAVYDAFEPPERLDLDLYLEIVAEVGARRVLDIGCGTGVLCGLLAERGLEVVGLDPAQASLDVARGKPGAQRVRWVHGEAAVLPPLQVDLAVMTGNVAQVFLTDEAWTATLHAAHRALRPGGWLVFETRVWERRTWEGWSPDWVRVDLPGVGVVETRGEVTSVAEPFVSFTGYYRFASDGAELVSESTLRFRGREEVERSLAQAGFAVEDVRDAPDRPGAEWVFVARSAPTAAGGSAASAAPSVTARRRSRARR